VERTNKNRRLTLSSRAFESVESVRILRSPSPRSFALTHSINPPFIGGVESVRAWRGPLGMMGGNKVLGFAKSILWECPGATSHI